MEGRKEAEVCSALSLSLSPPPTPPPTPPPAVRIPILEWPIIFDIKTRPRNVMSRTGTKDLQMVNLNVRVLTKPNAAGLPQIYEDLGMDYDERVLPSIVNETCKQVVAQFTAVQLLTQRDQVRNVIARNLIERAREFNIIVEDIAVCFCLCPVSSLPFIYNQAS